jgi:osmotically-inducible protein OsmY
MTTARRSTILLAGVVGAGLAFFLDPAMGRSRRAQARDRIAALLRRGARRTERLARRSAAETHGLWRRVTHPVPEDRDPDDRKLADRVRSELLGSAAVPRGRIVIDVEHGAVILRGQVERPDQVMEIEAATRKIPGVLDVVNLLHIPGTAAPNKEEAREASRAVGG